MVDQRHGWQRASRTVRWPRHREVRVLAVLAAVALATAACGDDSDRAAEGGGAGGGAQTLRVAVAEPVGVLDPHAFTGNFIVLDMVYEPLVRYGTDGELEPGLAESWEVAEDGLTVTFDLRDDVVFHDGTAFDAEAVKWNLDRWVGGEDFSFFRTAEVIEEVTVVDDDTVELALSAPYEPLLQELTVNRPVRFLSPASAGDDDSFSTPVGTGPWAFESSSETEASLVRFDGYWGDESSIDQVDFSVIPDSQTRASALRAGEVDLIGGAYLAPINPVEAEDLSGGDDVVLMEGEPDTTFLLGFNTDGPLGDQDVRDAVSLAIDLDAVHEAVYAGFGEPASTLFPPTVPDAGTTPDHVFDPDRARELLDGETVEVTLLASDAGLGGQSDSRAVSQAVAAALEEVGIAATIDAVDGSTFFDEQAEGNYDLSFFTTFGAPYDPSSSVVSFLTAGAGGHPPFASSPELDRLVDEALFAEGDDERADAYQAVFDELEQESSTVPLTYLPRLYAVGPDVEGFEAPATEYVLDLADVSIDR